MGGQYASPYHQILAYQLGSEVYGGILLAHNGH